MSEADRSDQQESTAPDAAPSLSLLDGVVSADKVEELHATHKPRLPLNISFRCYDIPFTALASEGPDGPTLSLSGYVGALPFTAESPDARRTLKSILSTGPELATARLTLFERNRIIVQGELPLDGEVTPSRIVATATAFVATSKPLIDLIKACLPTSDAPAAA